MTSVDGIVPKIWLIIYANRINLVYINTRFNLITIHIGNIYRIILYIDFTLKIFKMFFIHKLCQFLKKYNSIY